MKKYRIKLDRERICRREDMAAYMKETFAFDDGFGGNLDALRDSLSEVSRQTDIYIDQETMAVICTEAYAWKVFRVLTDAAAENPYLTVKFR